MLISKLGEPTDSFDEYKTDAEWIIEFEDGNVATIYNSGTPTDLTSLSPVAWWRLGENAFCPNYTASPNVWTIPDQIGSNDGTTLSFYSPELHLVGIDPTALRFKEYYKVAT